MPITNKMSELSFTTHNDKFTLVNGDKKKYSALLKQVNSRWSNKYEGWLVPVENDEKLKQLVSILFPPQKKKSPTIQISKTEKAVKSKKTETVLPTAPPTTPVHVVAKQDEQIVVIEKIELSSPVMQNISQPPPPVPVIAPVIKNKKFRRSRSPRSRSDSSSDDDTSSNKRDPVEFYKTFKHSPNTFSSLHDQDENNFELSSSDEESKNSSSSEDYPNPSPNRKKLMGDSVFDEMDKLRKRLYQLEQKK